MLFRKDENGRFDDLKSTSEEYAIQINHLSWQQ